jgi:hypothetical protein
MTHQLEWQGQLLLQGACKSGGLIMDCSSQHFAAHWQYQLEMSSPIDQSFCTALLAHIDVCFCLHVLHPFLNVGD